MTDPAHAAGLRWVFDTNVLVGAAFWPASVPSAALRLAAQDDAVLLFSHATLAELHDMMQRPKFDRYARLVDRQRFVADLMPLAEIVPPSAPLRACRDPRDDKFLEAAVHGGALALVTGDADLLALHPFHGVAILRPEDCLVLLNTRHTGPQVNEPPARYGGRAGRRSAALILR